MSLTDEQIAKIFQSTECWEHVGQRIEFRHKPFARAIESAATAPLMERIAELERELEAVRKDAGWRAIETAPDTMTGTVVVRWVNSDGEECRELDYKEDGCWIGWHEHAEHVEIIGGHGVSYTPPYTGWMPLPPPPDAAKEKP
jgi:hypothetical protein